MNTQLFIEIKNSNVFKFYNFISQGFKFIKNFKWIAAFIFILGFLSLFIDQLVYTSKVLLIPVFTVGIGFAFVGMVTHILVGIQIRNLSKKYDIEEIYIKRIIQEIYEN